MFKSTYFAITVITVGALLCPARAAVPVEQIAPLYIDAAEGDGLLQDSLRLESFWVSLFRAALLFPEIRKTAYEGIQLERQRRQQLSTMYGYAPAFDKEIITTSELDRLATTAASSMKNNIWRFNSSVAEKYRDQASVIYSVVP